MKNVYVGCIFIQLLQIICQFGIWLKFNLFKEVICGKWFIVVDDLIVWGNIQCVLVCMLCEVGVVELYVCIVLLLVKWLCFYGIDFFLLVELIVNVVENEDEMLEVVWYVIGVDMLGYILLWGMVVVFEQFMLLLCIVCFDGKYLIELFCEIVLGKNVIEYMFVNVVCGVVLGEFVVDDEVFVGC